MCVWGGGGGGGGLKKDMPALQIAMLIGIFYTHPSQPPPTKRMINHPCPSVWLQTGRCLELRGGCPHFYY